MHADPSMAPLDLVDPRTGRRPQLLLTREEHLANQRELERLRAARDRELPARLREARTFVTADAVAEIAQIHGDQAVMDARILALEELVATATVVDAEHAADVVALGSVVAVVYERTGRRATYLVTGAGAHAELLSASAQSPVGQALLGRRAGELVEVHLPGGRVEPVRILSVTARQDADAI